MGRGGLFFLFLRQSKERTMPLIYFSDTLQSKTFVLKTEQKAENDIKKQLNEFLKYIPFGGPVRVFLNFLTPQMGLLVQADEKGENFVCFVPTTIGLKDLNTAWCYYTNLEPRWNRLTKPVFSPHSQPKAFMLLVKRVTAQIIVTLFSYFSLKYIFKLYKKFKADPEFLRTIGQTGIELDPSWQAAGRLFTKMDTYVSNEIQKRRGRPKDYVSVYRRRR